MTPSFLSRFFFCLVPCTSLFAGEPDAAMFQGGALHTGFDNGPSIGHVEGLAFSFQTGGAIRSIPTFYHDAVYFGSSDGFLYALNAKTGSLIWKYDSGRPVNSCPAAADGLVYFTGRDAKLHAVEAVTGKSRWTFDFGPDLDYAPGFDYYASSPVVDRQEVFVGSGDGFVYALDARSGKLKWKYDCHVRVRTSPAVVEDRIIVGTMGGHLIALDRKSGRPLWTYATMGASLKLEDYGYDRSAIVSSPSVENNLVTFGCRDGVVYAVNLNDGQLAWKFDQNISWPISTPGRFKNRVFVGTSDGRFFQAIDAASGSEIWRLKTKGNIFSSPVITSDRLYFADLIGYIYGVDHASGQELWRFKTGGSVYASPMIHNGILYCGSDDGVLYAIRGSAATDTATVRKAVFWDTMEGFKWFRGGIDEDIRDFFKNEGYQVLNSSDLMSFMNDQIAHGGKSVIVFATNRLPADAVGDETASAPIRQYLDSKGKVVFLGTNPLAYRRDSTGAVMDVDFSFPSKVFGVQFPNSHLDRMGWYSASVTRNGMQWGLRGWWVGFGAIEPKQASTVLATDEEGKAGCWVKNYGGPEGSGLVQLWIPRDHKIDLTPIKAAAEFGL